MSVGDLGSAARRTRSTRLVGAYPVATVPVNRDYQVPARQSNIN